MTSFRHWLSLLTALIAMINLGFWVIFLVFLGLLRLLITAERPRRIISIGTEWIYRRAASVHNFWMFQIVGIDLVVHGELPDHPAPIIVSNHQSWMDIPVLHYAITANGPILKFLYKRELLWVPIIGWICYSLNFPRLNRGKGHDARKKDLAAIQSFSQSLSQERGALMIYAEGTRFTQQKHENQNSPYQYLLIPRPGGLKIALESVFPETPVIDVTIVYDGDSNFWRCLGGDTKRIQIFIRHYRAQDITDVRAWLDQRWCEKDTFFEK
jgi:1-acyl-sn-glycerol-3-phosphate acyltransferase